MVNYHHPFSAHPLAKKDTKLCSSLSAQSFLVELVFVTKAPFTTRLRNDTRDIVIVVMSRPLYHFVSSERQAIIQSVNKCMFAAAIEIKWEGVADSIYQIEVGILGYC